MIKRGCIMSCVKLFLSCTLVIFISCASTEQEDYLKSYGYYLNEYIKHYKLNIDIERTLTAKKSAIEYYRLVNNEIEKGTYTDEELKYIDSLNLAAIKSGIFKK